MAAEDFTLLPDLASRALGGGVVHANDEFFAAADHLVLPAPPVFTPRSFDHKGQVYDGWETRRRRGPGRDVAIIRLGAPGVIRGIDIDTAFFTGNFPPYASVEAIAVAGYPDLSGTSEEEPRVGTPAPGAERAGHGGSGPGGSAGGVGSAGIAGAESGWVTLVAKTALRGDARNLFAVHDRRRFTHVRLTIYPDGGVARLRVHGDVVVDPALLPEVFDVAALAHGARVTGCSNQFYGHPQNMLMPGVAQHMGDGWETSRRRDDGNDWVVVELAAPADITHVDLDTTHFKGNAPGSASLKGHDGGEWFDILPDTPLRPDTPHRFPVRPGRAATHVRLDIHPDGGMARLRLHGRPVPGYLEDKFRRHVELG
nr:allantoicase [uncultured Actinoplanes sp.]